MSSSWAALLPFRTLRTSWRSSSSRWSFCGVFGAAPVRADIGSPLVFSVVTDDFIVESHPEVEGEASRIVCALQPLCATSIVIGTGVRSGREGAPLDRLAAAQALQPRAGLLVQPVAHS